MPHCHHLSDAQAAPKWHLSYAQMVPQCFCTQKIRSIYVGLNSSWFYCFIKDLLWMPKWESIWTKSKTVPKTNQTPPNLAIYLVGVCVTQHFNFLFYPGSVLLILKQSGNM